MSSGLVLVTKIRAQPTHLNVVSISRCILGRGPRLEVELRALAGGYHRLVAGGEINDIRIGHFGMSLSNAGDQGLDLAYLVAYLQELI